MVFVLMAGTASAEGLDEWYVNGTNTVRLEDYGVHGNGLASPYPFTGIQAFDELNLNFGKTESPYDQWRGMIYGVFNGSDYRSPYHGPVPERLNLTREKGDAGIPYYFEAGDYFAYFSFRTLQRSLKGVKLELQPQIDASGRRYSLLFISGSNQPSWRNFSPANDYFNGISWLMEAPAQWRLSLNFLYNTRRANPLTGALHRNQATFSVAGERDFTLGRQRLTLEGELAGFSGDHDGTTTPESGQGREDTGAYLQLSGLSDNPLTYRLRFERYGKDYRPNGAVITPERNSFEGYVGWQFVTGLSLRGRGQFYRYGFQTGNPTDTQTFGINLSGPFFPKQINSLTGSLDAFVQDVSKSDGTIDRRFYTANVNLNKPLLSGWNGRIGVFLQRLDDFISTGTDTDTQQYSIGADHAVTVAGFNGSATLGMMLRQVHGGTTATSDWSPTLAYNLVKGPHQTSMFFSLLSQNPSAVSTSDVNTSKFLIDYRYTKRQDTMGVEFNVTGRTQDPGQSTSSYRVSAFWTHSFEKLPKYASAGSVALTDAVGSSGAQLTANLGLLLNLVPGLDMNDLMARLEAGGIKGGIRQPGVVVYEIRLMEHIDQRQRLALLEDTGSLSKAALIINFDDIGNRESVAQTFERVRKILIDRFGNPSSVFEEGSFSPSLAADVNSGNFIRIMEWTTASGRLRFGIPRRMDGQVRIEIQHARSFGPPRDTLWSIETVR